MAIGYILYHQLFIDQHNLTLLFIFKISHFHNRYKKSHFPKKTIYLHRNLKFGYSNSFKRMK